ncbi:MAG TPA: hypothetical protein VF808_20435 [Ktedonobacterales bacterium]
MGTWGFLRRRTVVAALGAVTIGAVSAALGVAQTPHRGATSQTAAVATQTPRSPATATVTPRAPTPVPTRAPAPTPTMPTAGQAGQIEGTVTAVNASANMFTLRVGPRTFTVTVTSSTAIAVNGVAASNLSPMTVGMSANVEGVWQSVSELAAASVDAQTDR